MKIFCVRKELGLKMRLLRVGIIVALLGVLWILWVASSRTTRGILSPSKDGRYIASIEYCYPGQFSWQHPYYRIQVKEKSSMKTIGYEEVVVKAGVAEPDLFNCAITDVIQWNDDHTVTIILPHATMQFRVDN